MSFKAGDVIFFKTDGSIQDLAIMQVSELTHVGIFINDREFIEARVFDGVVISEYNADWRHIRVYRSPEPIGTEWIEQACKHVGEDYDLPEAVMAGLLRYFGLQRLEEHIDDDWKCSELTGYILRDLMGVDVCPRKVTQDLMPDDLEIGLTELKWQIIH